MFPPTYLKNAFIEEFWGRVAQEERKLEGPEEARNYLDGYGRLDTLLAALTISDDAPKWYAAKRLLKE